MIKVTFSGVWVGRNRQEAVAPLTVHLAAQQPPCPCYCYCNDTCIVKTRKGGAAQHTVRRPLQPRLSRHTPGPAAKAKCHLVSI